MKYKWTLLLVTLFTHQLLFAQKITTINYSVIDKKALLLPDSLTKNTSDIAKYILANFKTNNEKVRAVFIWIATNIAYDVENMFAINFYEKREDKISKPLINRKGICENYATLFYDICLKSGIKSFVIEGYTKQNGIADYIPHAWCAAFIDSTWYMFDPTWGAGYINSNKFYRKINNDYFKVNPSTLIKSHMPFDFLWQFLYYSITNQEFYEGKTQPNKSKVYFNFPDSISIYEKQSHIEQLIGAARRIESNGVKNSLIFDRLQHIKYEIENERQTQTYGSYNSAIADYNEGINDLNDFIQYRNRQFNPLKSDPEIQGMIDTAQYKITRSKEKVSKIKNPDVNLARMMTQLLRTIEDAMDQVSTQQNWLKEYFSKGKMGRRSMFYKVTWFGIPIN